MDGTAPYGLRHRLTPRTGLALKQARLLCGLGRGRASTAAGISPTYLQKLERAERAPSVSVAEALIEALHLDVRDPDLAGLLRDEAVPGVGRDKEQAE